jgi:type I restriction enzyme S subunit
MKTTFSDVLKIKNGRNQRQVENPTGQYPIYGSGGVIGYADSYICEADTIVIGRKGSINNPIFVREPFWNVDTAFGLVANRTVLLPKYLYYFCKSYDFEKLNTTVTIPSLTKANLLKIEIPLVSLADQKEIASILDKVTDLMIMRARQLDELDLMVKSRFVEMFGDPVTNPMGWDVKNLKNLYKVKSSKRIYQNEQVSEGIRFLRVSDLVRKILDGIDSCNLYISEEQYMRFSDSGLVPKAEDILVTSRGTLGLCYIVQPSDRFYFQDGMISWLEKQEIEIESLYVYYLFGTDGFRRQMEQLPTGTTVSYLSLETLGNLEIMVPPFPLQNAFAAFVQQADKSKFEIQKGLKQMEIQYNALMQQYFG